jgi:iron complex outermembrane receptor protein
LDCVFPVLAGNRGFDSEKLLAYQIGWRAELLTRLFLDTVAFYHDYDDLLTVEPGAVFSETSPPPEHQVLPFVIRNQGVGESYGVSVAADFFPTDRWRLRAAYSYLHIHLHAEPRNIEASRANEASPQHQAFIHSELDLPGNVALDSNLRYVDHLPAQDIGAYFTFDLRLAVRLTPHLEVAAVGQNLWDSTHREFAGGTEVERSAYGQVRWQW